MPTRTVTIFVCSACKKDQLPDTKMTTMQLSNGSSATGLHYDICPACKTGNKTVQAFLAMGEKPARASASAKVKTARKPRTAKKTVVKKRSAKRVELAPLAQNADGDYMCPDCDYTHPRAQAVGRHRGHVHGYVSPRKAA